jgi:hypothetical protein
VAGGSLRRIRRRLLIPASVCLPVLAPAGLPRRRPAWRRLVPTMTPERHHSVIDEESLEVYFSFSFIPCRRKSFP